MEMAEYRDDGVWEVVPTRAYPRELIEPADGRGRRPRPRRVRAHSGRTPPIPAPRPRLIGWSLVFVAASNLGLVIAVLAVGMTPIGLMACVAVALSGWLLVVAELLSIRRLYGDDAGDHTEHDWS